MRSVRLAFGLGAALILFAQVAPALAQTCEDQHRACVRRGHTETECRASTNKCLQTGRWIGPAGIEYPITKPK